MIVVRYSTPGGLTTSNRDTLLLRDGYTIHDRDDRSKTEAIRRGPRKFAEDRDKSLLIDTATPNRYNQLAVQNVSVRVSVRVPGTLDRTCPGGLPTGEPANRFSSQDSSYEQVNRCVRFRSTLGREKQPCDIVPGFTRGFQSRRLHRGTRSASTRGRDPRGSRPSSATRRRSTE